MPVRSLNSAVLRWPTRDETLRAARRWAAELHRTDANVLRVLCIGSCARGDYAVGSDIDLIVVVRVAPDSIVDRRRLYEPKGLPVPEDLWVYTVGEFESLAATSPSWFKRIRMEALSLVD